MSDTNQNGNKGQIPANSNGQQDTPLPFASCPECDEATSKLSFSEDNGDFTCTACGYYSQRVDLSPKAKNGVTHQPGDNLTGNDIEPLPFNSCPNCNVFITASCFNLANGDFTCPICKYFLPNLPPIVDEHWTNLVNFLERSKKGLNGRFFGLSPIMVKAILDTFYEEWRDYEGASTIREANHAVIRLLYRLADENDFVTLGFDTILDTVNHVFKHVTKEGYHG